MSSGILFNVQRFSTEDGPGIRTTAFLKGCPLHCAWCHNPEGLGADPELVWYDVRCIGARDCLRVCAPQALAPGPEGMRIDRTACNCCGDCASACPSGALELVGAPWSAEALVKELLEDRVFYDTSGGGVTFSGGEPLLQRQFLAEVMRRCKTAGLEIALDTCAAVPWRWFEEVLPWVDLVLLDLKLWDSGRHVKATGRGNEAILENASRLSARGIPLWVRTPVVPGWTADLDNIRAIARFISGSLDNVRRWDLLAYTNLGRPKYHRLDRRYLLEDTPLLAREEMERIWNAAAELVPVARWSGATR